MSGGHEMERKGNKTRGIGFETQTRRVGEEVVGLDQQVCTKSSTRKGKETLERERDWISEERNVATS